MANTRIDPSHSLATLSLSSHNQSNPIDLTLDDDEPADGYAPHRVAKRQRTDFTLPPHLDVLTGQPVVHNGGGALNPLSTAYEQSMNGIPRSNPFMFQRPHGYHQHPQSAMVSPSYRPNFAGPSQIPFTGQHIQPPPSSPSPSSISSLSARPSFSAPPDRQVIDLTGSPSPPPPPHAGPMLRNDLPPNTPVCIGVLTATALVLYHDPCLYPVDNNSHEYEWATVRLQYEHSPNAAGDPHTIHIKPMIPNAQFAGDEPFGAVEQRVASLLGPMLGRGMIRFDAKVRRCERNVSVPAFIRQVIYRESSIQVPISPLQMLVSTPKGNISAVGSFLFREGLFLDHPTTPPFPMRMEAPYFNPHNPPPGGHNRALLNANRAASIPQVDRWTTPVSGKSVEVQRSQVDDLFRSFKSGEELAETEPCMYLVCRWSD